MTDLRLWIYTWRRERRLLSLFSRVMNTVRPRLPYKCVPKSDAGSDGRFTGGAQGCGSLGGAHGRKAATSDVHDGCERCSPGLWLLTVRLVTIIPTPFKEEDLHNVLVEVDSGPYTLIFASVSAASFTSSSRALKSSGIQRSRTWPNGVPGLPPEVHSKVQAETWGIRYTASVWDRALLAGTSLALRGREHFPSCNIDEDVSFWSQHGLMDLNGKKRYQHDFMALGGKEEIHSGTNTVYVGPLPRACTCQHGHVKLAPGISQGINYFYSSPFAGAVFDIPTGLGALRAGVSSPLTGRTSPCLPSSASSLEVERQAPLRFPGHRAAIVGESTLRQGGADLITTVPIIAPVRGCVEDARRLRRGDVCLGRGSQEGGLEEGPFCKHYTVSQYWRDRCIDLFGEHFAGYRGLQGRLSELSGPRFLCYYKLHWRYYADELFRLFFPKYPEAYAMGLSSGAPPQEVALAMAWARQEVDDCEVAVTSSEDASLFPTRLGRGPRTSVGSGPSLRDVRDGCGRCSSGMWFSLRGTWKEGLHEKGIFVGRRRRTASRSRWVEPYLRYPPAWLVNPSASGLEISPQDYGLACRFVYLVLAGSKVERTSCAVRSSLRNWFPGQLLVWTGIVCRRPTGCSGRARVGFDSEWGSERSVHGVWSSPTVWLSWGSLQGSAGLFARVCTMIEFPPSVLLHDGMRETDVRPVDTGARP